VYFREVSIMRIGGVAVEPTQRHAQRTILVLVS
jgi:hypothetical protein